MKTILSKTKQEQFLDDNWTVKTLHFKWGKTGSHKCWLYDRNDNVLGSAGGGGYDKKGTALGQFMNTYLNDELRKVKTTDYYGLTHWNKRTKKSQNRSSKHTKILTATLQFIIIVLCGLVGGILILETLVYLTN